GVVQQVPAHALVLTFDATNWSTPQTVYVQAAPDALGEGERTVAVSHGTASADPRFNHVAVRNVEVRVIDDDRPGLVLTQADGSTRVLEGNAPSGIGDSYGLALAKAPAAGTRVTVQLAHDGHIALSS